MAKKEKAEFKKNVSIKNRKASHEYHFVEKFTAGMVLTGTEIKSIRQSKVNMQDAFCLFVGEELFVRNMHIAPYEMSTMVNHEAKADRKLLLNKRELRKIKEALKDQGVTIVPTFMYITSRGWAKIEIAVSKGKKLYDKRQDLKAKDQKREMGKY
ncbi:SsrA-binding protein SmpB [Sediminitomix flava]|uniref:SsrA-binding protein n=1 Tax=Sediminitomix flava TaxID=379075 RepID=A0A315Z683_SEDFL|nr:SsrA-binding protein SmpB [Sediminitomix flava]PWJ38596.1 SsrA-binding protein [Sediminitomix flava]